MAAVIRKAIIKSYDAQAHRATVQIAGSLGVWLPGVRVATDIPPNDVVAGRECTVLFLDPSNPNDALVLTIQGAPPSGGGGSTTFLTLTDTPGNYADDALKTLRVNADEDAVEFWDLLGTANAWGALQTFNAGLQLAAGQAVKDSGGTARYTPATASPHNTLSGDVRIDGHVGLDSPPATSPRTQLAIRPSLSGESGWRGINITPSGTATGALSGILGNAVFTIPAGSGGTNIFGLSFQALFAPAGAASNVNIQRACSAQPGIVAIGAGKSTTVSEFTGFYTDFANLTVLYATATLTAAHGLYIPGRDMSLVTCNALYGIRVGDFTNVSGNCRLLEIGPATPYLRVTGGGGPGALLTNVWMDVGTVGLRQLQVGAANSGGAGFRQVIVPN